MPATVIADAAPVSGSSKKSRGAPTRRAGRKPVQEQRLSSYIVFGFTNTVCLGIFVTCYVLVMASVWPLLHSDMHSNKPDVPARYIDEFKSDVHHMDALKAAHLPGQEKVSKWASAMKQQLLHLRQGRGVTDGALMEQATAEFQLRRTQRKNQKEAADASKNSAVAKAAVPPPVANTRTDSQPTRRGAIVLGMHRSGTSMLTGLLVQAGGYFVGGPLIGSAFDNAKGFFERVDVVLQNDEFMREQNIWWSHNVRAYDSDRALQAKQDGKIDFIKHGKTGLDFFNNPNTQSPWLQKDPRMCITLKTWLGLMQGHEPAVVFTYRHPLQVAQSLKKREQNFSLELGLRLWIIYNMRAIQNSKGLCMVKSSNTAILAEPLKEVQRISAELTSKYGVPKAPSEITQEVVDTFVDPKMQHKTDPEADRPVIATYGDCEVHDMVSDTPPNSPAAKREQRLYGMAMKIYCDFGSGAAYEDGYKWPSLD